MRASAGATSGAFSLSNDRARKGNALSLATREFPRTSQQQLIDVEHLCDFPNSVVDALTNFLRTGKTGQAYGKLLTMSTNGLRIVAGDKRFSSAARVNAALILGSFNDREPDGKPVASELPVLIYMVKGDPKDPARFRWW